MGPSWISIGLGCTFGTKQRWKWFCINICFGCLGECAGGALSHLWDEWESSGEIVMDDYLFFDDWGWNWTWDYNDKTSFRVWPQIVKWSLNGMMLSLYGTPQSEFLRYSFSYLFIAGLIKIDFMLQIWEHNEHQLTMVFLAFIRKCFIEENS